MGKRFSEGARRLWLVMHEKSLSSEDVRRMVDASSGLVSQWLWGEKVPGREYAEKLKRLLDVEPSDWSKPSKDDVEVDTVTRKLIFKTSKPRGEVAA